ncbi:MAG: flavin reductase family protein [Christensenellales bacterium]|jgi:flavin reductase (DIM6/NTAB) family NADH-FMN oxidoreductase RutF
MRAENVTINPFEAIGNDWALVASGSPEKSNLMTVSWGGLGVIWARSVVYIFIRESRYTKEFIDAGETFSLSFFDEDYRPALDFCGANSGRDFDKWKETGLTPAYRSGTVYPAQAKLSFLCKKLAAVPVEKAHFLLDSIYPQFYGDNDMHTMYVGEILETVRNA